MFLFRKVETRVMPAIKLPATPLLASDEEMDAWMADYQAALDRTEPSAEPAADPAIPEQPGQLPEISPQMTAAPSRWSGSSSDSCQTA